MKRKIISLVLACVLLLSMAGCGEMGQIADSVVEVAMQELKDQVVALLERNKLEVVELKTAFGKLNDEGSKYQFFIAALIRSDSTTIPQSTADTMGKLFTKAGLVAQSTSQFSSEYLVHKTITFKQTDFSSGNYYVIYGYAADLTIDLPDFTLPEFTGKK